MLWLKRFSQQRVVLKVDHAEAEVIAGAPISVHFS
jgi:hypothetical protein